MSKTYNQRYGSAQSYATKALRLAHADEYRQLLEVGRQKAGLLSHAERSRVRRLARLAVEAEQLGARVIDAVNHPSGVDDVHASRVIDA